MKKLGLLALIMGLVFIASCSDDAEDNLAQEQELSQAELQTILNTDEITSAVDTALAELYNFTGATQKSNECYTAEYTDNGFTATFNNCVLNGSENINGTLTVVYGTDANTTTYTATFVDFFVGTIKVNGTRTFTLNSGQMDEAISFTITSDISVEYDDGKTISENGAKTFEFVFEDGQDTLWNLSGNWTVMVDGDTYTVSGDVSRSLICEYWTMGSMQIGKNGLQVDVDFGDGTCDDKATVTYPNGAIEEITL
ncbi:hypothetical protein [uncultured Croceitalea sp.]|uniref:hypothetical protein n=1 Tax=uncultured Croceitalea sp. TaxID=1798908 RepID=UPI0033060FD1